MSDEGSMAAPDPGYALPRRFSSRLIRCRAVPERSPCASVSLREEVDGNGALVFTRGTPRVVSGQTSGNAARRLGSTSIDSILQSKI